ncbi:hypothetical protein L596_005656 [Steinernema carpocapsae]|uniref:Complex I assembly factor TIMMDC1, mitochondrial n=1 Tax=Steinernema carpocapsae TaxID=34508 RepID=A0A4V6YSZ1_STECR|nr:hypothetical protein L596_005656 [Steinernema carpocapsae]
MRFCRCSADSTDNAGSSSTTPTGYQLWCSRLRNAFWPTPNVAQFPSKYGGLKEYVETQDQQIPQPKKEPETGWERILQMYDDGKPHMEIDVTVKMVRAAFFGGFFFGGYSGHVMARERYNMHVVGKKFLSPRDAMKRKLDFSIVMFAKKGFSMGFKAAALIGSVVFLSTHIARYRDRFSLTYFPAISASVGSVLAFPIGVLGSMKAIGLGLSSGTMLSMVVYLYALALNKSVDAAYKQFRDEYDEELREELILNERALRLMKEQKLFWKQSAIRMIKEMDDKKLLENDAWEHEEKADKTENEDKEVTEANKKSDSEKSKK